MTGKLRGLIQDRGLRKQRNQERKMYNIFVAGPTGLLEAEKEIFLPC